MIHSECSDYRKSGTVSRSISKKTGSGIGASAFKFPHFVENITKYYELCGENESEVGRRLDVKPQLVNRWRIGKNAPTKASRFKIASVLGISEYELMYGEAAIREPTGAYGFKLSARGERLMKRLARLLAGDDDHCWKYLNTQLSQAEDIFPPAEAPGGDKPNGLHKEVRIPGTIKGKVDLER